MPLGTTTHNVNQILYFGTGVATPISEGTGFTMSITTDWAEDSSWGDDFKTYKPGMSDFTAEVTKHYDHNETSLRAAALAQTQGNFYWYPDRGVATDYVFFTGFVAFGPINSGGLNAIIGQTYQIRAGGAVQPTWRP